MMSLLVKVFVCCSLLGVIFVCTFIMETPAQLNTRIQHSYGEKIHILLLVENSTTVALLIKSILIYRNSPLHFHFILGPFSQTVLEELMTTWNLPSVQCSFYPKEMYFKGSISQIPSIQTESSKLIKLLAPSILPLTVDSVIILDSDVLVTSDVQKLWVFFYELRDENKLFAVTKGSECFDTSVMLFDLRAMREMSWNYLWFNVVETSSNIVFTIESIINSMIILYPDIHFILSCVWNVNPNNQQECGADFSQHHIIKWNLFEVDNYILLHRIHTFVKQYDGTTLQRIRYKPQLPKYSNKKMCQILKRESEQIFRTHLFYYGRKYKPIDEYETTLVTQLSLDRLDKFHLLINHWDGPISITMYGTDTQAWNLTQFISENGINRINMAIHIVYEQGKFYPVNHLRNIALNAVSTPYVFLNDGDFLPSFGLFSYLKKANKVLMTGSEKRALVIPAFNGEEGFTYPKDKADLQEMLQEGSVRMFCVWCAHQTHGPTNYSVWEKTSFPYRVEWAFHFEPYVVVRSDVVRYDQRFVGYGWNKVSQLTEMKAQGYEFVVLPDVFIIHSPHQHSADREIWNRKNFKFCINTIWKKFIQELLQKYGVDCLKEYKNPPAIINIKI